MALINCLECGKEISDKSKACVHCGFPLDILNIKTSTDEVHSLESDLVIEESVVRSDGIKSDRKKSTKIHLIIASAVVILLIAALIITNLNKSEFIDGVSLGMSMSDIEKIENNSGLQHKNGYIVLDKDLNGEICDFGYIFDDNNELVTISAESHSENYSVFSNLFNYFYSLHGSPVSMVEDYDGIIPYQEIIWQLKRGTISIIY